VKKYYSIAGMTVAMYDSASNKMKYLLTDQLGSVVAITDNNGSKLSQQRYLPFGQVRTDIDPITQTDFGFTGQRSMSMGLMDYHARMYDALLMKFVQPDTEIPTSQGAQGLNRYSYVNNNPILNTDPTGHVIQGRCNYRKNPRCDVPTTSDKGVHEAESLKEMLELAFTGYDAIILTGDALEKIKSDPAFIKFRAELLKFVYSNKDLWKKPLDLEFADRVAFGGSRDPGSMFLQLLEPSDKKYAETWAAAKNELTWMLRTATIDAVIQVDTKGNATISYNLIDQFDLKPNDNRTMAYNVITGITGTIWHDILGVSAPNVYANWSESLSLTVDINAPVVLP
jgi:RHS repeat-associated protein